MLQEILYSYVIPTLATAITGFLVYLIALGKSYIKAKIKAVEDETLRKELESALQELDETATTCVKSLEQSVVSKITKQGQLTPDDKIQVKQNALHLVKKGLSSKTKETLNKKVEVLDEYLSAKIEEKVHNIRSGK